MTTTRTKPGSLSGAAWGDSDEKDVGFGDFNKWLKAFGFGDAGFPLMFPNFNSNSDTNFSKSPSSYRKTTRCLNGACTTTVCENGACMTTES